VRRDYTVPVRDLDGVDAALTAADRCEAQPLRIAFIGARGVAAPYSGIETYYEEVGSRLAARGHEVVAYCRSHFTPPIEQFRGIRVRRLPSLRTKHFDTFVHTFLSTLDAIPRRFDIIQYHALGPSLFSFIPRLAGQTTVSSVRGLDWQREKWGRIARLVLQLSEIATVRFPTTTVVVSETLRRHYQQQHARNTAVIPNGVFSPVVRPADRILQMGLRPNGYLLFAGRLSPEKGCHLLIKAYSAFETPIKLALVGGSSFSDGYIAELKSMAGPNVVFTGAVDRTTMEELHSNCYAFVLPSQMEGLSNSLLEAFSYGNCIITSDIEENLEVVGDAGIPFRRNDLDSLREALQAILTRPDVIERCRQRARAAANGRWDWDQVARATERFYYQTLDARQVARS